MTSLLRAARAPRALDAVALAGLLVLYVWVAATSWGYDDEFFNVSLVEDNPSLRALVSAANHTDVHPPGSYVVNAVLLDALGGSWSAVRVVAAVLTAIALGALWLRTAPATPLGRWTSYLTICLNPTVLLWCTGIRWYAYLVPLLIVLMLVVYGDVRSRWRHWGTVVAIGVAGFYLEYLAVLLVVPLVAISLARRRDRLRGELVALIPLGIVGLALCAPQLHALFSVHLPNSKGQTSGLTNAVLGAGTHVLAGQGTFPFHPVGVALVLANLLVALVAIRHLRTLLREPNTSYFSATMLLLIAAGLTAKFRNLVTLSPAQGLLQARVVALTRSRVLTAVLVALLTVGNVGGMFLVATHQRTIKGSWNTPYGDAMEALHDDLDHCSHPVVVAWDQPLVWHAGRVFDHVVDVYGESWEQDVPGDWDCLVAVSSNPGSLPAERHDEFTAFVGALGDPVDTRHLGKDADAAFKRTMSAGIPAYFLTLELFKR